MKPYYLLTASAAALALGAGAVARVRSHRLAARGGTAREADSGFGDAGREATRRALQYFVVPVWVAAGVADWWCHRATDIEHSTGLKETLIHLLMLAEAGVPVIAGLFVEVDAPVLAVMIAAFLLHEATAMWDVRYAVTAREVKPAEQHVHSFLEMVPLMAVAFVSLLHWPQLRVLAGLDVSPLRPLIRRKAEPLPVGYVLGTLATFLLLEVTPYLEEAWRDWRAYPARLEPPAAREA